MPVSHITVTMVASGPSCSATRSAAIDVGAGGRTGEQALLAGEPERHRHRLVRRDPLDLVGDAVVPERHDEAGADAVDLVRAGRAARQNGRFGRLHGDDRGSGFCAAAGLRAIPRSEAAVPTLWTKPSIAAVRLLPDLVRHP